MPANTSKITFLGTGTSQGIPVIACQCPVCSSPDPRDKRLRTSAMVDFGGKRFVIDTGPDFREQMLRNKVMDIDAVLYTHEHRDHTVGIDDVRAYNFLYNKDMPVFATELVQTALIKNNDYIFQDTGYSGKPRIALNTIEPGKTFEACGVPISPIAAWHAEMPVLGFRFGDLVYLTDINALPEESMAQVMGCKVLVLNALQREVHYSHLNLKEAIDLVSKIKPEQTYFVHMSHRMGLHAEVQKELPKGVQLAWDGLEVFF